MYTGSLHLSKISEISYIYIADFLKEQLQTKVSDPSSLNQGTAESNPSYADRLLRTFILVQMPDAFYQMVGYISLGLFIGLFVFAGIWAFLFLFTLIRTFTSRPWTIFGPWFWIIGSLQVVLGVGLTVFGKFIFPNINFTAVGIPLKSVILAPRTYAFIPSMIYLACFVIALIYVFFKIAAKRSDKERK